MCTIDYEARRRRLRISGRCGSDDDAAAIRDAIDTFSRKGDTLILDLTALTDLSGDVAAVIVEAGNEVACDVTVLRKHGTEVDRVLTEATSS